MMRRVGRKSPSRFGLRPTQPGWGYQLSVALPKYAGQMAKLRLTHLVLVSAVLVCATSAVAQHTHKITAKRATAIALKKYPGKVLHQANLEHEDGRWQYEIIIKFGKKMKEVNVDAETGKIASVENTSAAEEARESKHGEKG